jgi:hypothetical protein
MQSAFKRLQANRSRPTAMKEIVNAAGLAL